MCRTGHAFRLAIDERRAMTPALDRGLALREGLCGRTQGMPPAGLAGMAWSHAAPGRAA
jgi:hypothetical protein